MLIEPSQKSINLPPQVDFAGSGYDLEQYARDGAFLVSLSLIKENHHFANPVKDCKSEGWLHDATLQETGLCVWRSGLRPILDFKRNGDFLNGCLAVSQLLNAEANFPPVTHFTNLSLREDAALIARAGVLDASFELLAKALEISYEVQLESGFSKLPKIADSLAQKYIDFGGSPWTIVLFPDAMARSRAINKSSSIIAVEPWCR